MAWQNPKTNWKAGDIPTASDFNRIEGNIEELENTKETPTGAQAKVNTHAGSKQTHGISGSYYIAKTSRSDQLPAWNDIQGKPSLVTTSDLSNGLAAKVDKPSSATSGNIAVFDGGPGKIKDGGVNINSLPIPVKPGNTITIFSNSTQRSLTKSNSTFTFEVDTTDWPYVGKFRVSYEGQSAQFDRVRCTVDYYSMRNGVRPVSQDLTMNERSFTLKTIDMQRKVIPDSLITITFSRVDGDGGGTVYFRNVKITCDPA